MNIFKNSLCNLTGSLLPTAVTLFTVPLYLRLIGVDRYGILVVAWVILGYFGVFDLGLGRATAQRIAALRDNEPKEREEVFWTALILNMAFGIVGMLLLWPVARLYFSTFLNVSDALRLEILAAVPWLIVALPVSTVSGVLSGALQGREQFVALNFCRVLESIVSQCLPLVVVWFHGPQLSWLVPATLAGRVLVFVLMFVQCYYYLPLNMALSVRRDQAIALFRFGGWVTLIGFIAPLLTILDRFLIGSISGPKALTYYTIPFSLVSRAGALPGSLSDALFPKLSASSEKESFRLMDVAVHSVSVIMTPLIIASILILKPFLIWWVGSDVAMNAAPVGEIIAFGFWFNGLACIPVSGLLAKGRPDLVAKCHLAELIPYLVFLAFALYTWGVLGAALAWSMRVTVDALLLFSLCRVAPRTLLANLYPMFFLGLTGVAVFVFPMASVIHWALGTITLLGSLVWAWITAPASIKRLVLGHDSLLSKGSPSLTSYNK